MTNETNEGFAAVGMVVLGLAAVTLLTMWQGFVLTILWGWFMVPLGVPGIGVAHAVGLASILALKARIRSDDKRSVPQMCFDAGIKTAVTLGIGAIANAFMV